jgi:hypothetical protein
MITFLAYLNFYHVTIAKYERLITEASSEMELEFRKNSLQNYQERLNVLMS